MKNKKTTNQNNAIMNEASEALKQLLPNFQVKTHLLIVPQKGLKRLNIRMIEKVPTLTLTESK